MSRLTPGRKYSPKPSKAGAPRGKGRTARQARFRLSLWALFRRAPLAWLLIGAGTALASLPERAALQTHEPAIERRVLNDGQLVLEGIPPVPAELVRELDRARRFAPSSFLDWAPGDGGIYVRGLAGGVQQLLQVRRPGDLPRQLTFGDEPIGELARQPGGRLLAFTMDRGGDENDQIHLMDARNGATRQLTDGVSLNNRMTWDREGRRLAWRSTRRNGRSNDLWIMDIDDQAGARLLFEAPDGALWKPVSFSRDGRLLLVQQFQSIVDTRIHVLDLDTGRMRELVGLPDVPTGNVAVDFDAEDRGVFFVSNQRGGAAEIGWAPLAAGEPIRWVTEGLRWGITEFELSPDGRRGAFVSNENGVSRLYLFDPARFRWRAVSSTPMGTIFGLRFDPAGRRLGMTLSTPSSPREAHVLRLGRSPTAARRLRAWTDGRPGQEHEEPGSDLVSPRQFTYEADWPGRERELRIPGFAYVPRGAGPFPVVIYLHGGPESQFRPSFHEQVQLWASRLGVAVLAPNYRGSLGYGAGYLALDDGRRREHVLHDIEALLDLIDRTPTLDATRVAVYGASYGGYLALASAVHFSDRLVAAVNRAGISHFVNYLENTEDYRRDLRRGEYGDERDPDMRAFLEAISPLNHADRISVPLLIVQGQNDPVVPAGESERMVRALRERGREVWYLNALNEGHDYAREENLAVYRQVAYLFLEKHLLPDRRRD